jgi:DNA-binding CsgD family transcriptional regulator/tetratricopeptide (TPR) repeat protein
VPPHERLLLHRAALRALAAPPLGEPDVARLAHHAEAAGDVAAHVEFARAAGVEAAAFGAHAEAAAHLRRAARHAQSLPLPERADLLERLAYESVLVDDLEVARDAGVRLLACRRALGDRVGEAVALRQVSRVLRLLDRTDEAERAAQAAAAILEDAPPGRELALVYDHVAWLRLLDSHNEEAIEWAIRAIAIAEAAGDAGVVAHARLTIGSAEYSLGRTTWRPTLEQALALAQTLPPKDAAARDELVARALDKLSYAVLHVRDLDAAARFIALGLAHTGTHDLSRWRANLFMERATLALVRADWGNAVADAEAALEANVFPHTRRLALVASARARSRSGEPGAWEALDEAFRCGLDAEDLDQLGPLAVARAEAHWLAGRADEVPADTDRALAAASERADAWWLGELAWLRRLAGIDEPPPDAAAEPYRLALEGRWRDSAERWRALGAPYEAALALVLGDTAASLRQALVELRRIGAHGATPIVAARLRAHGVRAVARRPRAATRRNPAGLTARELEVLALVAAGLQNREIASQLVVSPKTVEHHVSAILRKLEVPSRRDAAAAAPRLGI